MFGDSVKPIADAGKADLVASDARLADEITLIPTPGHSPGHMSIHIRSDGEEGLLTGDVAHHPCQMAHLDWSSTADSDPEQSADDPARTVFALCRYADAGDRRAFQCRSHQARRRCVQVHRAVGSVRRVPVRAASHLGGESRCKGICQPPALSAVEFPAPAVP